MREKRPLTQEEEMLKAYNAKLKREAVLRSLILGLLVGFSLSAVVAVVSFITAKNFLWIALAVWAAASTGATAVFYFTLYRSSLRRTAQRVDEIGLEERIVTMVQFRGEDNAMLFRQREDAHAALGAVSAKQIKTRVSRLFLVLLAALTCISVFMISYSTVLAGRAEELENDPPAVEEALSDEDKIIRDMLQALREEIDGAQIDETLRGYLHGLVDDLENSLKPEDSLEVKIARIMDTAEKIHKLIQDYLNRSTIAEELMKHDTTYDLGKAIDAQDIEKVRDAFQRMYDAIAPLVEQGKYDLILQTAEDIDASLEEAINTPPALQKALEDLRDAFLRALEPPPEGDEPKTGDEINEEIRDALDKAADALEDFFKEQQEAEDLDENLQDIFKDAMAELGQEFEYPEEPDEEEEDKKDEEEGALPEDGEDESGEQTPDENGDDTLDSVIDGQTSYKDVFDEDGYSDDMQEKLESGDLTDEDRQTIQDYFDMLK